MAGCLPRRGRLPIRRSDLTRESDMALVRPPLREVRSRIFDSARWLAYAPRPDDIIIGTFPKCGTTWMQRIVAMLLAASAAPAPVAGPWFDFRLRGPVEPVR